MDPAEAVRGFLDALGAPAARIPPGLAGQTGLYRSLLRGKRVLVVLDNARDAAQARPLLPGSPGCLAIVTSRDQLIGLVAAEGAVPLALDLPTAAEAHDLLDRRLGEARLASDPGAADEIIQRCARLPLALAIVAARAAARPSFRLADIAAELREATAVLDPLEGDELATDIRAVFSWSYHALPADSARLFRLLGLQPGPEIAITAAASLAAIPPPQARLLLAELARVHLLTEYAPGRYGFHDLLRAYAAELAHTHDGPLARHAAVSRLLDHYLHAAHHAATLIEPYYDPLALDAAEPGVAGPQLTTAAEAHGLVRRRTRRAAGRRPARGRRRFRRSRLAAGMEPERLLAAGRAVARAGQDVRDGAGGCPLCRRHHRSGPLPAPPRRRLHQIRPLSRRRADFWSKHCNCSKR